MQDLDFKDAIIDALLESELACNWIPTDEAKFLYNNTPRTSKIRQLLSQWILEAELCDFICTEEHEPYNTVEFLQDVLRAKLKDTNKIDGEDEDESEDQSSVETDSSDDYQDDEDSPPLKRRRLGSDTVAPIFKGKSSSTVSTCKYHEHGKDRPCYKLRFGVGRPSE